MSYIEQFEAELLKKLQSEEPASVVKWASEKIRSSYKNGAAAARRSSAKAKSVQDGDSAPKAE